MTLNIENKREIVSEVAAIANESIAAAAADYTGLTVSDMDALRKKARESNVRLKMVRNTLARRAVEGTAFECMKEGLTGPLILAFSSEEPSGAARVFNDYAKENDKLAVKLLVLDGKLLGPEQLEKIAKLPNREEALSMLLGVLQAPVSKLVRTVAAPHTKLVRTLDALCEQLS